MALLTAGTIDQGLLAVTLVTAFQNKKLEAVQVDNGS
jgi:hypothetical protein